MICGFSWNDRSAISSIFLAMGSAARYCPWRSNSLNCLSSLIKSSRGVADTAVAQMPNATAITTMRKDLAFIFEPV